MRVEQFYFTMCAELCIARFPCFPALRRFVPRFDAMIRGDFDMKNTPLEDITVLDLTTALAGPFATLLLAGLGAKVIKIENPIGGGDTCRSNAPYLGSEGGTLARRHEDDISVSALNRLRNKLGVTLNLKHPEARGVYADLVKTADVIVENFSRGTLDRLGAGYAFAQEMNPRIVYCSITGFGSEGEPGTGKAMDAIIQALSGVMMTSGGPDDPPVRVGVPFADLTAPLFGVIGVLAAIHQAQRTGIGQHVDVSMLGVMTMMVSGEPFDLLERCGVPQRTGLTVPRLAPFGMYRTKDGYVSICAPTEAFAHSLFHAIGRPELITDPRFAKRDDRVVNVSELDAIVEAFTMFQNQRGSGRGLGRIAACPPLKCATRRMPCAIRASCPAARRFRWRIPNTAWWRMSTEWACRSNSPERKPVSTSLRPAWESTIRRCIAACWAIPRSASKS